MASVTRRNRARREDRRSEVRDRLLAAVERLLETGESYTELSVERLTSEAGISRSTFYVYFADKGDLLRSWFEHLNEELQDPAARWWQLDGDSTKDDLRAAISQILNTYRPHTKLMATVYDAASYDPDIRQEVETTMSRNVAALRKHIKEGQREGWIAPDLRPAETAEWLMWMAERGQHRLIARADGDDEVERLIDAYTDIVWHTLYAYAPSRLAAAAAG